MSGSSKTADRLCDCGHSHFDHKGTDGGICLYGKCRCIEYRRTAPETPPPPTDGVERELLRQCCVWGRVFLNEAQRELIGDKSDYNRSALQLMVLLAELTSVVTDR